MWDGENLSRSCVRSRKPTGVTNWHGRASATARFDLEMQIGELGRWPFGDMVIERVDNTDDPAPDSSARYLFALSHFEVYARSPIGLTHRAHPLGAS